MSCLISWFAGVCTIIVATSSLVICAKDAKMQVEQPRDISHEGVSAIAVQPVDSVPIVIKHSVVSNFSIVP